MKKNYSLLSLLLIIMVIVAGCKKDQNSSVTKPAATANASKKTNLVLFPGAGWVPADEVHLIEPGNYLARQNDHILKLQKGTNKLVADFGIFKRPEVVAPSGNGTPSLNPGFSSLATVIPGSANTPNWITYGKWVNPGTLGAITSFHTNYIVPSNPVNTTDGQTLFIFNGLANSTLTDVLEPVLQWGSNSAATGGGNFWSVTNVYYVPGSPGFYAYTTPVSVAVGSSLEGLLTYNGTQADGSYDYSSAFVGKSNILTLIEGVTAKGAGVSSTISTATAPFIPQLTVATETLEAFSATGGSPTSVNDYPADHLIQMKSISITNATGTPTLSWTAVNNVTAFGQQTSVVSNANPNGEVDLLFHAVKPSITYPTPEVYPQNTAISPLSPTNTGGPATYTASGLPAGLVINPSTGVITGTPTVLSGPTAYTITATNGGGTSTFTITISVVAANINFQITNNSATSLAITFTRTDISQPNINITVGASSGTTPIGIPPGTYNIGFNDAMMPFISVTVTLNTGQSVGPTPGGSFTGIGIGPTTSMTAH